MRLTDSKIRPYVRYIRTPSCMANVNFLVSIRFRSLRDSRGFRSGLIAD